ncbi:MULTISPECIES: glycosyltransferase [Arthrobacter]|uniref:Glycosyltransferase n=2 Tax=Arthrobacter TaxID=1663 RepID=A0ABU9KQV3_9MICC|nr:glycosyltransferase [Arthrobacter sp. YJM1]MDP5228397.1 glycosyltransferase [Arthrobacter sp. YJM1]
MTARPRVAAVVVTYNRRALLEGTLRGLLGASVRPDALIVVDNASDDGTAEFLRDWAAGEGVRTSDGTVLDLVRLETNTGGAGGFVVGMERAVQDHGADYVWIMDDDTEPQESSLEEALAALARIRDRGLPAPSYLASLVRWSDGRPHPMNRTKERLALDSASRWTAESLGLTNIRTASFVSIFVSAEAIRRDGLPIADYFIWNDDFEFTARITRRHAAFAVPASEVLHHTKTFGDAQADPGDRFYYEVRNKLWVYFRSPALHWWERVLFLGASVRNWTRTVARSQQRSRLLKGLLRGVKDSLRAPRANAEVLAGVYPLREIPAGVRKASAPAGE